MEGNEGYAGNEGTRHILPVFQFCGPTYLITIRAEHLSGQWRITKISI